MILSDLIYSADFDINCRYKVYDCTNHENWHTAPCVYDSYNIHKPLDKILDMHIIYITINDNTLIIEVK